MRLNISAIDMYWFMRELLRDPYQSPAAHQWALRNIKPLKRKLVRAGLLSSDPVKHHFQHKAWMSDAL